MPIVKNVIGDVVSIITQSIVGSLFQTSSVIAVGDSFVIGGAGGVESFMVPLATLWGNPTVDNNGSNGTVLQNSNGSGGAPLAGNLMDNFTARTVTPTANTLVCAYGLNDGRYTAVSGANGFGQTFTAAAYKADFQSCLRRWLPIFGKGNIFLVTPHYISDAGLAGAGGGDFDGQSRVNYEAYVTACREVATEFGVWLVDTYAAGEPSTTVDNLHPSVASKDAIANLFLSATNSKIQSSANGITGAEGKIVVAVGYEAYVVDGTATEVALSVGDNVRSAADYQVVYRQSSSHSWEITTVTVSQPNFAGLNSTPAGNVGFTVNSSTVDSIDIDGTTSRNHISWDAANFPVGTRIQMDLEKDAFSRLIIRLSDDSDMSGTVNETVFDASFTGTTSVDHTTTVQTDYFGFLNLVAHGVVVTNLVITFP